MCPAMKHLGTLSLEQRAYSGEIVYREVTHRCKLDRCREGTRV